MRVEKSSIVLIPVGSVAGEALSTLAEDLAALLDREVACRVSAVVGRALPKPPHAYNARRRQFLSTKVLEMVLETGETRRHQRALGVIDSDLYVPHLNFVFGTATGWGALISLTRLRQSFYRLPEDDGLFRRRVLTEAVHELGHTWGLVHCADPRCVMHFSNNLAATDRKGPGFCPLCRVRAVSAEFDDLQKGRGSSDRPLRSASEVN